MKKKLFKCLEMKTLANSGSWEHKARVGVGHPLPRNELVSIISNQ